MNEAASLIHILYYEMCGSFFYGKKKTGCFFRVIIRNQNTKVFLSHTPPSPPQKKNKILNTLDIYMCPVMYKLHGQDIDFLGNIKLLTSWIRILVGYEVTITT